MIITYNTPPQIPFKWEVVEKNKAANNLLIKFQAVGKPDILVGTPFPPKEENVDEFMTRYAPFQLWAIEETTQDIEIGQGAEVIPVVEPAVELPPTPVDSTVEELSADTVTS